MHIQFNSQTAAKSSKAGLSSSADNTSDYNQQYAGISYIQK